MDFSQARLVISCSVAALLGGLVLTHLLPCGLKACDATTVDQGGDAASSVTTGASFRIAAGNSSEEISPGVSAPLDLEFSNPEESPMDFGGLTVTMDAVDAPNADVHHPCSTDDFTINQAAGGLQIRVGAGSAGSLSTLDVVRAAWPRVGMVNRAVNQDGCKSATVSLTYSATGEMSN